MRTYLKQMPLILLVIVIVISRGNLSANNPGSTNINGIGLSAEYSYTDDKKNDGAAYLSYRYGFIWIVSAFLTADAGYRFESESVNFKTGISGMILFGGFETGFTGVYNRNSTENISGEEKDGDFAPGMYIGLNGVLPANEFPVFLSIGRNFYVKNHEHEYYLMVTGIVNFNY